MITLKTLQNHRHAFEPIQDRPSPKTCWRVINRSFSALTGTIHQIYTKFFGGGEAAPLEPAPIVPLNFDLLPPEYQLHLLTFFDLPELAQFSRTAQYPNSLVSDPQIWKSIAARINCPINENSPAPIYKQVLLFIKRIQEKAAMPSWTHSTESIINILKRPTIDQIDHLQKWLSANTALYYRYQLVTKIKEQLPGLNLEVPGDFADLKSSHQIIAKAGEYSKWLLINQTLLRARDTLVVWQALAQAAHLPGPGLADLNTEDAVIEKSREFNDWFNANQQALAPLEALNLPDQQLTTLPEQIWRLNQLTSLDLRSNWLTSLPEQIGQLTQLQGLNLDYNQFTLFPMQICTLTQLQYLRFDFNQLTELPEQFGNLTQLKSVDLQDNQLTALPKQFGNLTQLQILHLGNNQISSLPEQICNLTQLIFLDLSNNLLTALPERFANLTQLLQLNLSDNPLRLHLRVTQFLTNNKVNIVKIIALTVNIIALTLVANGIYQNRASVMSVLANAAQHLLPLSFGHQP